MILFGHRGAAGEAPENTLGGFAHAWKAGVRAFELDIHLANDDKLVVIHDPTLERTTDGSGRVRDHTAAQLSSINAAYHFAGWPVREGVPALQDVLDRYHSSIFRWQLEIKTDALERLETTCALLAHQIDRHDLGDRVTVTSFDAAALERMRRAAPRVRLGLIRNPITPEDIELAQALGCSGLCVPAASGNKSLVSRAHQAGLQVTGWLGNTPSDLDRLLSWGVDSITTDLPTFASEYLSRQV